MGFGDFLGTLFSGRNRNDEYGSNGEYNFTGIPNSTPKSGMGNWGMIGADFLKGAAPGLAAGSVGLLANMLFPGTPAKTIATDLRSNTGRAAEDMRLGAAGKANAELDKAIADPTYNTLSPEQQDRAKYETRRDSRASGAARGILESGVNLDAENTALLKQKGQWEQQRNQGINQRFADVGNLTGGYQSRWVTQTKGEENPWATVATAAMAPAVKRGTERAVGVDPTEEYMKAMKKWFI